VKKILLPLLAIFILGTVSLHSEVNPRSKAFKSLLIPGWGELSMGKNSGYCFLAAEVILWASSYYFEEEIDLKDKASRNYAYKYAGVNTDIELTNDYLYNMKKYMSSGYESGGYNAKIAERAMSLYPDDPAAQTEYIETYAYSDEYAWEWESSTKKYNYTIMRKRMTQYKGYIKGITGGIVANHLFSAINTLLTANKINRLELSMRFDYDMNPTFLASYKF